MQQGLNFQILYFFPPVALRPNVGQITHNDAPQSVGILWNSDQPVVETSTW